MSIFHNTVSRRDFMKGIGLTGAGIGGAMTLSAPIFHDLDEAASSNLSVKRAWWVKERAFDDPTVEIDWSMMQRHSVRETMWYYSSFARYIGGAAKVKEVVGQGNQLKAKRLAENTPGCDLISTSLSGSAGLYNAPQNYYASAGTSQGWGGGKSFVGQTTIKRPSEQGLPKYQGTPEQNMRIMRAALRFYGVPAFGVCEYNGNIKTKLTQLYDGGMASMNMAYIDPTVPIKAIDSRPYVFEDVEWAYETKDKLVIPDKKQYWVVSVVQPQSRQMFRQGRGVLRVAANGARYSLQSVWQTKIQGFLRGIGYEGLGYPTRAYGPVPAMASAILDGMAEMARNNNVAINPDYGSTAGFFSFLTDLPLVPTPPIDAGMWRFCQTCKVCATACPAQAISNDTQPTWEITPSSKAPTVTPAYSCPGRKTFWTDVVACREFGFIDSCGSCHGVCTFNTDNAASIHQFVKATVANTSLFNNFMSSAHDTFGFGLTPEEEWGKWWDMSLPAYAFDTSVTVTDGGFHQAF
ncbi:MAG: reductive dehalogenase [Dehalogenimonas sp.]